MPMSIHTLGNSSVATVPTLLDLVLKGNIEHQEVHKGDVLFLLLLVQDECNAVCIAIKFES